MVIGGAVAATYFVGGSPIGQIAGTGTGPAPAETLLRVQAADGWVDVPPSEGSVVITASGPYRFRLEGVVYHVSGEKSVRVPMTPATSLAIRTVDAPTVAEVARAE